MRTGAWDYLVVTASNERQASAYRDELRIRQELGFIPKAARVLAVSDPDGKRVGSGGSTIHCLLEILSREMGSSGARRIEREARLEALRRLRILIVHAGGDSRRIPAYGACGKIFIPVPGESDRALGLTLLDRLLPVYLGLPAGAPGRGQVVVTTGDVLLDFDAARLDLSGEGTTGLGCYASPDLAARHGVFCLDPDGRRVRLFLQKPSPAEQEAKRAIRRHGQSILDIGVMSLDAAAAVDILGLCEVADGPSGALAWTGPVARAIEADGLDFYREICCAMGTEASRDDYIRTVRASGSRLEASVLDRVFDVMSLIPFSVELLPRCGFLHFGTPRQLITSGLDLVHRDGALSAGQTCLAINTDIRDGGEVVGSNSWVEGCRIKSSLRLGGDNVVCGVDVDEDLELPEGAVLDVLPGLDRNGAQVWFVRCYGTDDALHVSPSAGARLAGRPLEDWLSALGASARDVWDPAIPDAERQVWNGRFFPAVRRHADFREWLWMLDPSGATPDRRKAWGDADRYSFAEMALLVSQESFHSRRFAARSERLRRSLDRIFRPESGFSASELALILKTLTPEARRDWFKDLLRAAFRHFGGEERRTDVEQLELSRILHTAGSALPAAIKDGPGGSAFLGDVRVGLTNAEKDWLASLGLVLEGSPAPSVWAGAAREAAFENVSRAIVLSRDKRSGAPRSALRSDEIIWGRAPARLDLCGGWSDTPPYSLENGGCVLNAAVTLNGQPPIHAYARVIPEKEIRIGSIDHGRRIVVRGLDDLLDYRKPASEFGLAKAALALSGFAPDASDWPSQVRGLDDMLRLFGGGIEITTLAAIPSGSGLGTSSIMGAVLIAVIRRMMGRSLTSRELFHEVLRLEQELTTGGGWQDQVGGAVGGVKMITTAPGMVPDPRIHFVPPDVLDPVLNGGRTLLYYTGLRRLAKNILHEVVGRYLDRDRAGLATLHEIHGFPPRMVEAMAAKDISRFGALVETAWELKKEIDPDSTNDVIEGILARARPHIDGAAILGAGGGGFLLFVAGSAGEAAALRTRLEKDPPNDRARFFDFRVSDEGLAVTTC